MNCEIHFCIFWISCHTLWVDKFFYSGLFCKLSEFLSSMQSGKCSSTGLFCCFSEFLVTLLAGKWSWNGLLCKFPHFLIKFHAVKCSLTGLFCSSEFLVIMWACKWSCTGLSCTLSDFVILWAGKVFSACFPNFLSHYVQVNALFSGQFCMFSKLLITLWAGKWSCSWLFSHVCPFISN